MPGPALIAAAGSILGGAISSQGQKDANAQNIKLARENRAWQEKMSNSAYQRSATDLQKAGLNRILALGNAASTPSGNVAQVANEKAGIAGGIQGAVNSGLKGYAAKTQRTMMEKQLEGIDATINNTNAGTNLKNQQTQNAAIQQVQILASIQEIMERTRRTSALADIDELTAKLATDIGEAYPVLKTLLPSVFGVLIKGGRKAPGINPKVKVLPNDRAVPRDGYGGLTARQVKDLMNRTRPKR